MYMYAYHIQTKSTNTIIVQDILPIGLRGGGGGLPQPTSYKYVLPIEVLTNSRTGLQSF